MPRPAVILFILMLQGCFSGTSCERDSDAVTYAKSLSQERLATLYQDSKRLLASSPNVHISPIPDEFGDIIMIDMRTWGSEEIGLKLEGCFDHFVFLNIDTQQGQITVKYGEGPTAGEELLWDDAP